MGWETSDRRARLPGDWPRRVAQTRRRAGGRCEQVRPDGTRCPSPGSQCDHRDRGDNHDLANLQWLCARCHLAKTLAEATRARAMRSRTRPERPHPGRRRTP